MDLYDNQKEELLTIYDTVLNDLLESGEYTSAEVQEYREKQNSLIKGEKYLDLNGLAKN